MTHFPFCRRGAWMAFATLICLAAGGCMVPGLIAYKLLGPSAIPAKYHVPKTPLLVLVENAHSGSVAIPETDALAQVIYEDLHEHDVAPLIDPSVVHELRDRNPTTFGQMTIAEIGRRVGAQQVLYIRVHQLDIEAPPASDAVRLRLGARVRVVETESARTVWPESGDTEAYDVETPWKRIEPGTSKSSLNQNVLRDSGEKIARWFYDFKPDTMGEENQEEYLR